MTTIYHYNPKSLEYSGESTAKKDPIDGVDMIPQYATIEVPPTVGGHTSVYEGRWISKIDRRGEVYYDSSGDEHTILVLGEVPPAGATASRTAEHVAARDAEAAAEEASRAERARKVAGVEFEGTMCSATKEDMWGLKSIEDYVAAGQDTPFQFDNGNTLVLTQANMASFQAVWVPFRASFF